MTQYTYYLEDFTVGDVFEFGGKEVTREEVIEFASEYDPQPFHLDDEAAEKSLFKGLSSSGWHNCAMLMGMICDGYLNETASRGFVGFDEVRWMKPVRPGYVLQVKRTCLEVSEPQPEDGVGTVRCQFDMFNQDGLQVMKAVGELRVVSRRAA